jgi:DNA-binding transcriptional LysR family regulator
MVEGGFDIAIRNGDLKDSTLIARKLAPDRRIICASPDYLTKFGEPATPEELRQHQCITLAGLENWVFETPNGQQSIKPKGRLKTDHGDAVREACVDGLGLALNATWSVYKQLERGELVQVLRDYPLVSAAAIWAVYPSSRLLAPKVRAFIDYFSECFGSPPYWEKE